MLSEVLFDSDVLGVFKIKPMHAEGGDIGREHPICEEDKM